MKTVRLYHDDPVATGGPTTADVPEDAVEWMKALGWYLKEAETAEPKPAKASGKAKAKS